MKVGAAICAVFAAAALLSACEGQRFEPPDRAERVDRAEGVYSPALFDTIRWADEQARLLAGNLVYAEECRRCHGAHRAGAQHGRGVRAATDRNRTGFHC